jgi:hypothetical protein
VPDEEHAHSLDEALPECSVGRSAGVPCWVLGCDKKPLPKAFTLSVSKTFYLSKKPPDSLKEMEAKKK